MSTKIQRVRNPDGTQGKTWNPIVGCSKKSLGCTNCYALRMAWRLMHNPNPKISSAYQGIAEKVNGQIRWTGRVNLLRERLGQPLSWKKPRRIFLPSMGDLLHKNVPDDFIFDVLTMVAKCPQHTFQLLTKRAKRLAHLWRKARTDAYPNLWIGVSVEDQQTADERREVFKSIPATIKFVSYEPALEQIDWTGWEFVSQISSGGETGPGARPSHPDCHRMARDFCQENDVAYSFKSWGNWLPECQKGCPTVDPAEEFIKERRGKRTANFGSFDDYSLAIRIDKSLKSVSHLLDGREWMEMPG